MPYGETVKSGTDSTPLEYTGRENDGATGLYYYRARYYSPQPGRFISEDPSQFQGGVNFYAYVDGNPIQYVDPLGLSKMDETFGLPKKFWNWYHRKVKRRGDPDLTKDEATQMCEDWKQQGRPGPDGKRNQRGSADQDLLEWLIPWWAYSSPAY